MKNLLNLRRYSKPKLNIARDQNYNMKSLFQTNIPLNENYRLSLRICEQIFWALVGIACLGYTVFWSNFSELNITFPFLDFPIFVGEILLGLCLLIFFIRQRIGNLPVRRWYVIFFIYIVWLLIKALKGYYQYGPLAFRNAALFYYPLFAVLSYSFYRREFFTKKTIVALIAIILITKVSIDFSSYYYYPALGLLVILLLRQKKGWIKYCSLLLLPVIFPPKAFLYDSKSAIIGNMIAGLFLIASSAFLIKVKMRYKLAFFFTITLAFMFVFLTFGRRNQIASLTTPQNLVQEIKKADEYIEQRKKQGFKLQPLAVGLYNPDRISLNDNFFLRVNSDINAKAEKPEEISDGESWLKSIEQRGEMARIMVDNTIDQLLEDCIIHLKMRIDSIEKQKRAIDLLKSKVLVIRTEAIAKVERRKKEILHQIQSGNFLDLKEKGEKVLGFMAIETDDILKNVINKIFAEKDNLTAIYGYSPPVISVIDNNESKIDLTKNSKKESSEIQGIVSNRIITIINNEESSNDSTGNPKKENSQIEQVVSGSLRLLDDPLQKEIRRLAKPKDFKIGKDVLHFFQASGYILLPDDPGWQLGGKKRDFTIDFWVCLESIERSQTFISQMSDRQHYWRFMWMPSSSVLFFSQMADGWVEDIIMKAPWLPEKDKWYHIALVRQGTEMMMFVNGLKVAEQQEITNDIADFNGPLYIGTQENINAYPLRGFLDELRITSKACWTGNFRPSSRQNSKDTQTALLIHGHEKKVSELITLADAQNQTKDIWVLLPLPPQKKILIGKEFKTEASSAISLPLPLSKPTIIKRDYGEEYIEKVGIKTEEQIAKSFDTSFKSPDGRPFNQELGNMLFRFFIWRDMFRDMLQRMPGSLIFGLNFGMPQRSPSLEILVSAYGEWMRDGWIAPHNSYFHLIYRAGIVGLAVILGFLVIFCILVRDFIILRVMPGLIMVSIIAYWLTLANFLVFLELPHQAIPFWVFLGMVLGYRKDLKELKDKFSPNRKF